MFGSMSGIVCELWDPKVAKSVRKTEIHIFFFLFMSDCSSASSLGLVANCADQMRKKKEKVAAGPRTEGRLIHWSLHPWG